MLYRDDNLIVTKNEDRYVIIGWNFNDFQDSKKSSDKAYVLVLPTIGKQAILVKKEVGGVYANPMQIWSNLGKPRSLNREQLRDIAGFSGTASNG